MALFKVEFVTCTDGNIYVREDKKMITNTRIWNNITEILDYNGCSDYVKNQNSITFFKNRYSVELVNNNQILQQIAELTGKLRLSLKCLKWVK